MEEFEKPNYWAVIPANVRYANITPMSKLIYAELTALAQKQGFAWVSNRYLAKCYETSQRSIKRWIKVLEDHEFIRCEYDTNLDNTKRKIYINGDKIVNNGDKNDTGGGDKNVTQIIQVYNNTSLNNKALAKAKAMSTEVDKVFEAYNSICKSYPLLIKKSDKRIKAVKARLKNYTLAEIKQIFELAEKSSFLKGNNNRNWSADFDWLMNDTNMAKVIEHKYDDKQAIKTSLENMSDRDLQRAKDIAYIQNSETYKKDVESKYKPTKKDELTENIEKLKKEIESKNGRNEKIIDIEPMRDIKGISTIDFGSNW